MKTLKEHLSANWPSVLEPDHHLDISCGEGWYPFVFAVAERVEHYNGNLAPPANPTYIQCVKEKFGGLRIYISGTTGATAQQLAASDEIWTLIKLVEHASNFVCENCGMPGENRDNGRGWLKTWCEDCRNADPRGN